MGEGLYRYWVGAGREPTAFWTHGVGVGRGCAVWRRSADGGGAGRLGAGCWRSRIGTDGENMGGLAAFVATVAGGWRSENARRAYILRGFCAFRGCGWRLGVVFRL